MLDLNRLQRWTYYRQVEYLRLAVVVAVFAVAVACGPAAQSPESAGDTGTVKEKTPPKEVSIAKERGGKLVMSEGASGNPNDPHLVITASGRTHSMPVVNWLLKRDLYDEKFSIIGDLATSWEASKDGRSYTFKLQQGVKYHNVAPVNGKEFTSEDAKYSLMRLTADPSVIVQKWKPRFQRAIDFGEITSIDTPDKYTLVVNLKEPFAPFLDSVAHPGTAMLPREFVEKFPEKIILDGMVGTGPYIPVDFKNQQLASYRKNPDYWKKDSQGGQLPYLDELTYIQFTDIQSQLAAFRSRQLDITTSGTNITKGTRESLIKDEPKLQVFTTPTVNIMNFRFNTKFKPFEDVRVRRAVHLALDRHQFLELIAEGSGVVSGPITPTFVDLASTMDWLLSQPGYRKDKTQDIAEAKRLLKEAGYENGLSFNVMLTSGGVSGDIFSLLQDQLKAINITLKSELVDYAGSWVPRSAAQEFELSYMTHVMSTDGDSLLGAHISSEGGRNYGKFSDPIIDDLVNKQRTATSIEERRKYAQEAEKQILEKAPMVFLYSPANVMLAQPWVHNAGDISISGGRGYMVERAWIEKH